MIVEIHKFFVNTRYVQMFWQRDETTLVILFHGPPHAVQGETQFPELKNPLPFKFRNADELDRALRALIAAMHTEK